MNQTPEGISTKEFHGAVTSKDPRRFAIHGITDTIAGLKTTVDGLELHAGLKSFIQDELDKVGETGAELHLHDIEHVDNGKVKGFNLHLTITAKSIGARPHMIFKRAA